MSEVKAVNVFMGEDAQWYWNVKARNGRIVAQSEGYRTKQGAVKGVTALGKALGLPALEYALSER